jgi:hypothetical protein
MTSSITFGEVAELRSEKVDPKLAADSFYVGLEHIEQQTLSLNGHGFGSDVDSQKQKFYKGDILFGKLRPYFRKVVIAPFDGICSTDIWVVKPKHNGDRNFLFYWMASEEFIQKSTYASEGGRMPRAKWDWVINFQIPAKSPEEQAAIGITLRALDEKISINRVTAKTLEEIAAVKSRFERICDAAASNQVRLFIDAEETWIQPVLDSWTFEMMCKYNTQRAIIYNTVQMYRHDRLAFLKAQGDAAQAQGIIYGVKLVRGAYMEKERERAQKMGYPSPIQPDKASADRDYNEALRYMVAHHAHFALCAGSHNEESSMLLTQLMAEKNLENTNEKFFFAQLLGMSDHISYNLANAGYNVAKYVPFGPVKEVLPYLLRRADENTSVAGQTGRELGLISAELKRR